MHLLSSYFTKRYGASFGGRFTASGIPPLKEIILVDDASFQGLINNNNVTTCNFNCFEVIL